MIRENGEIARPNGPAESAFGATFCRRSDQDRQILTRLEIIESTKLVRYLRSEKRRSAIWSDCLPTQLAQTPRPCFDHLMAKSTPVASPAPTEDPSLEMAVPSRTAPAMIMSVVMHVILLTTLGLIWSRANKGTGAEADRKIGIAIVHRLPDRDKYVDAQEITEQTQTTESAQQSDSVSTQSAAAPPADLSPPIDLAGVLTAMESLPSPVSGTGLAGEAELGDDAFGTGRSSSSKASGSDTTTMVFGVSGSGSRFVYVFDRSDSMNGHEGRPLRAAKAELMRSLKSLSEQQQFQIIFYNDKAKPFQLSGAPLELITGEKSNVRLAERYVDSIKAFGGTKHSIALKMALRMSPDVIFFLTDARIPRLSGIELAEIRRRSAQSGTTIHAIEFGPDPVEPTDSFLRDLAGQNRGAYRYIDVRKLGMRSAQALPVLPDNGSTP